MRESKAPQPAASTRTRTGSELAPAAVGPSIQDLPLFDEQRFEIAGEHARGGAGMVLEARDRLLRRQVAVKQPQHLDRGVARFLREALITARLQHPAIVPIYDFGIRSTGEPCYAMRLVPGTTLREALAGARGLDERLALLSHVQVVADAVAYAHGQGIVHRDLKPGNVLVGPFGETVVIDWGLAKDLTGEAGEIDFADVGSETLDSGEALTEAGVVLGTPGYMPPEQARGEEADARSDVYAIGAILYALLVGHPPHRGKDPAQVLAGPPEPVEAREPGAPRDLVAIVNKAMAADRAARYPHAQALAQDLKQFATGQLVEARRYSRWALVKRWLLRHRATAVVGAALLLALVGGAAAVVVERNHTAVERDRATGENNRLRLMQANAVLERDPTAATAWLKTHRVEPGLAARAVEVAARAKAAGVARHVLTLPGDTPLQVCLAGSGELAGVLGRDGAIWLFDLVRGTRQQLGRLPEAPTACLFAQGDSQLVATAGRRGGMMSARLPAGPVRALDVPGGAVAAVRPLADGRLLVTGRDRRVHLVGLEGSPTRPLADLPAALGEIVPAPAGPAAYAADGAGGLWRIPLEGGAAARLEVASDPVLGLDLSSDGRQLVLATRTDLAVRDLASGETRWRRGALPPTHQTWVRAAGGGIIFVGGEVDDVKWWDGRGDAVVTLGARSIFKSLQVSRDGGRAAWADRGGTIFVADLPDQVVHTLVGHHTAVRSFALSADGRWLAATHGAAVRVFALPPPAGARRVALGGRTLVKMPPVRTVPARGEVIAAVRQREIVALDARTGAARPLLTLPAPVDTLAVSAGGTRAAVHAFGHPVVIVDLASGARQELAAPASRYHLAFAGEERLTGLDTEGNIHLWELRGGGHRILTRMMSAMGGLGGVAGSADGSRLLAGSLREGLLIDLDGGRTLPLDYGGGTFFRSGMSRDGGKIAIGFGDGRVMLWEGRDGPPAARLLTRREGFAVDLLFTRDAGALVVADEAGAIGRIDLATGAVTEIGRHPARIVAASLSASERWLATVDTASEIRIWEPARGGLAVLRGTGDRNVSFLGDDRLVSVAGEGWIELLPFDPAALVPAEPSALARWLGGLTTAQVNDAGEPVSPF